MHPGNSHFDPGELPLRREIHRVEGNRLNFWIVETEEGHSGSG
jgi:hypothetical protein